MCHGGGSGLGRQEVKVKKTNKEQIDKVSSLRATMRRVQEFGVRERNRAGSARFASYKLKVLAAISDEKKLEKQMRSQQMTLVLVLWERRLVIINRRARNRGPWAAGPRRSKKRESGRMMAESCKRGKRARETKGRG
jgi:hypothetical protein